MNHFTKAMILEHNLTITENGATASKTTGNACLDFFAVVGALRGTDKRYRSSFDETRAETLFAESIKENPLLTAKILFYTRDIREGLGEREVFRKLIRYAAKYHPEILKNNLDLIGEYGRFDDLYALVDTPMEENMWLVMSRQFEKDKADFYDGKPISLLAKWIKTPDASSKRTRKLGILTAQKLGYSVYDFKRLLRGMRKHIDVVERKMSASEWDKIAYSSVPGRAMMKYRRAFWRHDKERYESFINQALRGEVKINSGTLYPYDIVEKYLYGVERDNDSLEAQWRQLPDYVGDENILVMADVSGSMKGRPMASSIGLALYFAERNKGLFHNFFMTFSGRPKIIMVKGETLEQKIQYIKQCDWGENTDLEWAFKLVLEMGMNYHIPQEEMPKAIVVISDMEIDSSIKWQRERSDWLFYDDMKEMFEQAGYEIPNVIFWNVNSRQDVFHADANRKGVQLVSGQATSTFKTLCKCINMTPYEVMVEVLGSERYERITLAS